MWNPALLSSANIDGDYSQLLEPTTKGDIHMFHLHFCFTRSRQLIVLWCLLNMHLLLFETTMCAGQIRCVASAVRAAAVSLSLEMSQIVLHYVQVLRVSSRLSSPQLCGPAGLHLSSAAVTGLNRTHTRPLGPGPNTDL